MGNYKLRLQVLDLCQPELMYGFLNEYLHHRMVHKGPPLAFSLIS